MSVIHSDYRDNKSTLRFRFFAPHAIHHALSATEILAKMIYLENTIFHYFSKLNGHSGSENGEDKTDDMAEDGDSSPSPSEETRDDFPLNEMSIDNDSDKPFICEHSNCNKRFANKFLLKKHQFIHTGLRPHTCPYCNKRFNRKDNLLRHKKTHMQNGAGEDIVRRGSLPEGISSLFPALTGFPTGLETLKVEGLDGFKIEGDEDTLFQRIVKLCALGTLII
uniref:Zinc finger protein n=1 Tax=Heterorhabditis bacteriophora TaxID=37862 RepID=A0A1I7X4M2_HETBA